MALFFLFAGAALLAQDEAASKEKQMQADQLKAMQAEELKMKKEMLEQQQKLMELERERAEQAEVFARQARESDRGRVWVRSSGDEPGGEFLFGTYSTGSQSQLTLRKSFRETTSTSKGEFDVEPGIHNFRCMISGSVRSGEILIGIEYPDGKTFKELVINPSADINFSQSISIKEGEEKKYTGSWSYVIKAAQAEGNYMVQIMTN